MGTVTEKKDYMLQTKEQIRSAINLKGIVAAPDEPFRAYAGKIGSIKTIPVDADIMFTFNSSEDISHWQVGNASMSYENNAMKVIATPKTGGDYDPYIHTKPNTVSIDTARYKKVVVRMKIAALGAVPQPVEMYWQTDKANVPSWSAARSKASIQITAAPTGWVYYTFDLTGHVEWKDTITMLRFDPFNNTTGTAYIESVLVCNDFVTPAENQLEFQIKEAAASFIYDTEVYTDSGYNGLSSVIVKRITTTDIWSCFVTMNDPGNVYNLPFSSGFNAGDFILNCPSDWDSATNLGIITEDGKKILLIPSSIFINNLGNLYYLNHFKLVNDRIIQGQSFSELIFEQGITDLKYITTGDENYYPLFCNLYDGDWNIIGEPCSVGIIRIPNSVTQISSNLFSETGNPTIIIDKESDSISGSPWGANGATTIWLRG